MTEADGVQGPPGKLAADDVEIELRPRLGGRLVRGVRLAAYVVGELFMGLLPQPSLSDLVVIRRRDGAEISRTPAGDAGAAGDLLLYVRAAAERQPVEQFLTTWGAEGAGTGRRRPEPPGSAP